MEQPYQPINPNASKQAYDLLKYLYAISGKYILSGQHNYDSQPKWSTQKTEEITGFTPIIWGGDFLACKNRKKIINEAIRRHKNGEIITLMYHQVKPFESDDLGFHKSVKGRVSDQDWENILTPGTQYHRAWLKKVDAIAKHLKKLRNSKIPVLWRPYHEMNGVWFWWGDRPGKDGFKQLWVMMYERYTHHHRLNNLIWVWNPNAPRSIPGDEAYDYQNYYPGHRYVDVLAADIYHNDYRNSHHDQLLDLGQGKPIALGEVGRAPTPKILESQKQWVWFMIWAEYNITHNETEDLKHLFKDPKVLKLNT